MKTSLTTIGLFVSMSLSAQVNIPDANFKAFLVGDASINTNLDSIISLSEAQAVTGIMDVRGLSISDMTGIEAFSSIERLHCNNNQFTTLNLTGNTALWDLQMTYCFNVTSVDVSNCPNLMIFNANNSTLTSLDLSGNPLIQSVTVNANPLTYLNVKNGNNFMMSDFYFVATSTNLMCITVDNPTWSAAAWTNIDPGTIFSTNCSLGVELLKNQEAQQTEIYDIYGRVATPPLKGLYIVNNKKVFFQPY